MRVFDQSIASKMLSHAKSEIILDFVKPSHEPCLVILGGQPGSGKSSAIEIIEDQFDGDILSLNGDDFKTSYPNYDDLMKVNSLTTAKLVQPYSDYVVNELKKIFAPRRYNIIIEGTMRTTDVPLSTLVEFKNQGYKAEAYVVSSHYYASRVACLYRCELDWEVNGYGRAVPVESHDDAYQNIPNTLKVLIESKLLDDLTILSRNGEVLGQLSNGDDVIATYCKHREKLTNQDFEEISSYLNDTLDFVSDKKENGQIHDILALQKEFYTYFVKEHLNTNDKVLDFYEKIDPELISEVRKDGKLVVNGINGGTCYLQDNIPNYLNTLLSEVTGHHLPIINTNEANQIIEDKIQLTLSHTNQNNY